MRASIQLKRFTQSLQYVVTLDDVEAFYDECLQALSTLEHRFEDSAKFRKALDSAGDTNRPTFKLRLFSIFDSGCSYKPSKNEISVLNSKHVGLVRIVTYHEAIHKILDSYRMTRKRFLSKEANVMASSHNVEFIGPGRFQFYGAVNTDALIAVMGAEEDYDENLTKQLTMEALEHNRDRKSWFAAGLLHYATGFKLETTI